MKVAIVAAAHLIGVGLMIACFFMRTYHLRQVPLDVPRLKKAFFWDNVSLLVVMVVMGTGLRQGPGEEFARGSADVIAI